MERVVEETLKEILCLLLRRETEKEERRKRLYKLVRGVLVPLSDKDIFGDMSVGPQSTKSNSFYIFTQSSSSPPPKPSIIFINFL